MRAVVAGAGPIGTFCAMALARRGHEVVLVDRDPGPAADGSWRRVGVMQFRHPHFFRAVVRQAFLAELPDVWAAILAAGGEERLIPGLPEVMTGLACRRSVVERVLRASAARETGLEVRVGHIDDIVVEGDTARGLLVDGEFVEADFVVAATGRASRLGDELRGPVEGGSCGFCYVSRMYRARPGQPGCPLPTPSFVTGPGYICLVLPQDDDTLTTLIVRPTSDADLVGLRHTNGFEAATRAIPNLAPWTDPAHFVPITEVMVGGGLTNTYRHQGPRPGAAPARGLYFVGDAVCTTNPAAGRGIALGVAQAQRLLALLDDASLDPVEVSAALDAWSAQHLRPWFLDHVRWDTGLLRRFAGEDIDLDDRIPSDVICAAGPEAPEITPLVGMYQGMAAGPDVLDSAEARVRELLRTGWRPALSGPTAAELAKIVERALDSDLRAGRADSSTPALSIP